MKQCGDMRSFDHISAGGWCCRQGTGVLVAMTGMGIGIPQTTIKGGMRRRKPEWTPRSFNSIGLTQDRRTGSMAGTVQQFDLPRSSGSGRVQDGGADRPGQSTLSDRRIASQDAGIGRSGSRAEYGSVVTGLIFLSASGGLGLTTMTALMAKQLRGMNLSCALVDLDLDGGGMDVLVGIEGAPGMRLGRIRAPLGRVDPQALHEELPVWDGIPVLSNDPWSAPPQGWWDVDAAVSAMAGFADLLLIDAGRGRDLGNLRSLRGLPSLLMVDMTVLGLARAKALLHALSGCRSAGDRDQDSPLIACRPPMAVIGMMPTQHWISHGIDPEQAEEFLGRSVDVVLNPQPKLSASILDGRGLERVPRAYARALHPLVERIAGMATVSGRGGEPISLHESIRSGAVK